MIAATETKEKEFDYWEWLKEISEIWPGPDGEKNPVDFEEMERRYR